MSKKNKLSTRRNHHQALLEREKSEQANKLRKVEKKKQKLPQAKQGKVTKQKKRGIRIRKGVRVQGIKVTDADSKRKATDALKTQQALKEMEKDQFDLGRLSLGSKGPVKMEQ